MDEMDKRILNIIQAELPVDNRPFLKIAGQVGITEDEVIDRLKKLKEKGFIRRIGGVFDSNRLGFESTLVALRVKPGRIKEVAEKINAYRGVTHNYERDDYFNLWFTLVAGDKEEIQKILSRINEFSEVEKLLNLPALKLYKIGLNLSIK